MPSIGITRPELVGFNDPAPMLLDFDEESCPYHLVFYGEKTSLAAVCEPMAERFNADLYLPTGELSDTMIYQMAAAGARSKRRMIVFSMTDLDPSGWAMLATLARKLQALKDLYFPTLEFEVRPIALTAEQAINLELPSTPLKESELRGDRWRETMGREQAEIDALATLRPDVLREIIIKEVAPFYDKTLKSRLWHVERDWRRDADKQIAEQIDGEAIATARADAEQRLAEIVEEIEALEEELQNVYGDITIDVPVPELPAVQIDEAAQRPPLISSAWPWVEQTAALKARKTYEG
jgi:hypothetical protein